jgi:biopolymer transport protein ExbB
MQPIHATPTRPFLHRLLLGVAAILALTGNAHAWWNSDWTLRKKIVIDTTSTGVPFDAAIGTAPVLIRLHDGDFNFDAAKQDGTDIRFVAADDKTLLTYHIESIDSQIMSEGFVWVKVPDLKPGTQTTIYMYYGNSGNSAEKVDDPKGTYDSNTVLVYHFAEKGAAFADSSGNSNNSKNPASTADSLIGTGLRLTGHVPVVIPASPSLEVFPNTAMTWSAWIKPASLVPNSILFSRQDGKASLVIGLDSGAPFVEVTDANGGVQRTTTGAAVSASTWHHLAVVVTAAGKISLYLDGAPYGGPINGTLPQLNTDLTLGADLPGGKRPGFNGDVDELQIAKVARDDAFIKFASVSQGGGDLSDKLVVLGPDEQTSTWLSGNSTFGILIRSLTPDGWAVICLLTVMAIISWTVMVTKASFLNKNAKGSTHFLKAWTHVASDLTVLDGGDLDHAKTLGGRVDKKTLKMFRNACIYQIYHTGVEEVRHRMSTTESSRVLSPQSIQAIRASLDTVMVREQQKLNKLMVFLTIAISGGPFLGLLGTVVGVMITFAAIAAAGDVNVNAIAPGIAAALLATVAGLSVAIPALFGYNYLISRIKDATTDMHVFVDEFVTKCAEYYRPRSD